MNLHPHRELRSRRTNRPRPPHLRQPGFFIPALSCPVHTSLFSHLIPPLFPQRQHFPRFSAIAAWPFSLFPCYRPSGRHCHPITLPQRQHFPRFSAVVALPFSPPPCYRPSGRHCHPVTLPQRQHFPRFSAVAAWPFPLRTALPSCYASEGEFVAAFPFH